MQYFLFVILAGGQQQQQDHQEELQQEDNAPYGMPRNYPIYDEIDLSNARLQRDPGFQLSEKGKLTLAAVAVVSFILFLVLRLMH